MNKKCNGCKYRECYYHGLGVGGSVELSYRCTLLLDTESDSCEWKKEDKALNLQKYLEAGGVTVDELCFHVDGTVTVEIYWGDWKHDHARCDWLMSQIGYEKYSQFITEEDGNDCYSAVHFYKEVQA